MSNIFTKKVPAFNNEAIHVEVFNSANEVVEKSATRKPTSDSFFHNKDFASDTKPLGRSGWYGVDTFGEAKELMKTGYQPTVEKLGKSFKANINGSGKRISFFNDVVGFTPIVPLALMGVPNSMLNSYMKPIKAKVIDIYYDMTASCGTKPEQIIEAGQKLLGAIISLEMQGYKFNLYAIQSYFESEKGADVLCVKVKASNTPLDLKRISFPLTHTAFFRCIGFDWYSKVPGGKFRYGYGNALGYNFNEQVMNKGFEQLFGKKCVVFSAARVIKHNQDSLKDSIVNAEKEVK